MGSSWDYADYREEEERIAKNKVYREQYGERDDKFKEQWNLLRNLKAFYFTVNDLQFIMNPYEGRIAISDSMCVRMDEIYTKTVLRNTLVTGVEL